VPFKGYVLKNVRKWGRHRLPKRRRKEACVHKKKRTRWREIKKRQINKVKRKRTIMHLEVLTDIILCGERRHRIMTQITKWRHSNLLSDSVSWQLYWQLQQVWRKLSLYLSLSVFPLINC
jgi:hypothetical protein